MSEITSVHVVALAGGSGTRFWPMSQKAIPKQLLRLFGSETMLEATLSRVADIKLKNVDSIHQWAVVGASHAAACKKLPGLSATEILVEPRGRNTAAAIALACTHIRARDPKALMVVLPADHHVTDDQTFRLLLAEAIDVASRGAIVTLGIKPTGPEIGYGYLESGHEDPRGGIKVLRFYEKPDISTAKTFFESGKFFWNAGIFVMRCESFTQELERQLPQHAQAFQKLGTTIHTPDYPSCLDLIFDDIKNISVDYGIMEGAENVVAIAADCGWSDVGSFDAWARLLDPNCAGNSIQGRGLVMGGEGCLIRSDDHHVVAISQLSNIAVIHSAQATLVVPLEQAQSVRDVVQELEKKNWKDVL
jgi:mannose-1-phosphate guanylyltransferase